MATVNCYDYDIAAFSSCLVALPVQSQGLGAPETLSNLEEKRIPVQLMSNRRVIWEIDIPESAKDTAHKMLSFLYLPSGWDSYQAKDIQTKAILDMMTILGQAFTGKTPKPFVVPTTKGGIQLEWHTPQADLEIESTGSGHVTILYEDAQGNETEEEYSLAAELPTIAYYLSQISG